MRRSNRREAMPIRIMKITVKAVCLTVIYGCEVLLGSSLEFS